MNDASNTLQSAKLQFETTNRETAEAPTGQIVDQEPQAGVSVDEGGTVTLIVATVPGVRHLQVGLVTSYSGALPRNTSAACAAENRTCAFAVTRQVAYGAKKSWKFMRARGGTACTSRVFGDPLRGTVKKCYIRRAG